MKFLSECGFKILPSGHHIYRSDISAAAAALRMQGYEVIFPTLAIIRFSDYARFFVSAQYDPWGFGNYSNEEEEYAERILLDAGVANVHRGRVMFADPVVATELLEASGYNVVNG